VYENLEKLNFYKLSKYIKKNKGMVEESILDLAYVKAYEMTPIISVANARKKSGVIFKKDDVEGLSAEVYVAIKKYFNPSTPPHDLNAFVNTVINNKLADLMKERIKQKQMYEGLSVKEKLGFTGSTDYSHVDKLIMVKEAVRRLKPLCQKIIQLVAERYKVVEIIESTGLDISQDAMRQRMRECRKSLGRLIGGYADE